MKLSLLAAVLLFSMSAIPTQAAEKMKPGKMKSMPELTQAQRDDMAVAHEKMAACLRTTKPIMECHKEMMESCKDKMGKDACPMMGHMHGMMGKGKHHHEESKEDESEKKAE